MSGEPAKNQQTHFCSHEFLASALKEHDSNLTLLEIQLNKEGTYAGDNYMSTIYTLKLTVKNEEDGDNGGKETPRAMPVVLKALPTNPPMLKYIRELKAFEKEVTMFKAVFPELCGNVPFDSLPKFVYAHCNDKDACVIMEDLKISGYKMADRIKGLDFDHAKLAVTEMAKFHGLSFIKFRGDGHKILDSYPNLVDKFWVSPDQVSERNKTFISGQLAGVKKVMEEEGEGHVISRIERQFQDVFPRMHRLASVPQRFPAVVNMGDCWTNNMMFKYGENGKATEIKFLDFQLARVTSRCSDLTYLLYTSLALPVLNERFQDLVQVYHDAFTTFVTAHGGPELLSFRGEELSWEYLNIELEHYRSHGTTLSLIYTPLMLASFESVPDMNTVQGKDLENMGNDESSDFAVVWKGEAVRKKLIAVASGHLPMCFKPAQPSAST